MPKLNAQDQMQMGQIGQMQGFNFSAIRTEHLGATEYTLVTIAVDESGSVSGFKQELRDCLLAAVASCQKSPRSDNLLLRVLYFSASHHGLVEVHGFKPLAEIDPTAYPELQPRGGTPLYDAVYSGVGASNAYAKQLTDDDFLVNGIVFIITDGCENASRTSAQMLKQELQKAVQSEEIESLLSILVGINAAGYDTELRRLQQECGLDAYLDAGMANAQNLAKLAGFVSRSVSSQSQALGTGGPSQVIAAVI